MDGSYSLYCKYICNYYYFKRRKRKLCENINRVFFQRCQAFLKNSLENDNHANYCCPYGEIGRLCPLNRSKVCPYCWFARCEIEGLVERWQICNGDSNKWNEIISGFEYDTSSDDNEDDDDE